jgi:hypothetical protein
MVFNFNSYFNSNSLKIFYTKIYNEKFINLLNNSCYIFYQLYDYQIINLDFILNEIIKNFNINNNFNIKENLIFCIPSDNILLKEYNYIILDNVCFMNNKDGKMIQNFIIKTDEIFNKFNFKIDSQKYFELNFIDNMFKSNLNDENIEKYFKYFKFLATDYLWSNNIGDWVQTIAACQFFPEINLLIERDNYFKTNINKNYNNIFITNGWYWGESKLKYYDYIDTVIPLSIHFSCCGFEGNKITYNNIHYERFIKNNKLHLLNLNKIIGTRDEKTKLFLNQNGIDSDNVKCMTLTLKRKNPIEKKNIVIIDERIFLNKEIIEYLEKKNLIIKVLNIENIIIKNKTFFEKILQAKENLDLISEAKLIITSRLHITLPAISLGSKVIYISEKDSRHDGYQNLIKYWFNNIKEISIKIIENIIKDDDWFYKDELNNIRNKIIKIICKNYQIYNDIFYDDIMEKIKL